MRSLSAEDWIKMLTRESIAAVIADAVGNPTNGIVAEMLPVITDAVDQLVNPKDEQELRVLEVPETR